MLKPKCSEFIIATARMIRRKPKNFASGPSATAGIGLHRIFDVVRILYSEQEFRTGLDALFKEQKVILVAFVYTQRDAKTTIGGGRKLVKAIPKDLLDGYKNWFIDIKGKPAKWGESTSGTAFRLVRLYVVADGLPRNVAKLCDRGDTLVQKILKSIKK